jgi:hypothetical protein
MSGGPTVTADLRVAGINVSILRDSQLVSFLVPARFAVGLIDHVREGAREGTREGQASPSSGLRAEISRQIVQWQAIRDKAVANAGVRPVALGPYRVLENAAPWLNCWSSTNAGKVPKPRAAVDETSCSSETRLYIADDLSTGQMWFSHDYVRSVDLNPLQFAAFLSLREQYLWHESRKWHTPRHCHESFVAGSPSGERPALRAQWCARGYFGLDGLYDVWLATVTQDSSSEALVSRLYVAGVSYEGGLRHAQRFLSSIRVRK